ncbi:MAG TPA: D-2-hydroxyacid dehydrogenase [Pirellulaceae bacterium]|nr:D-2-hydroxyacid dehydrogenase [Pirellulaceae bacterium]HMO91050.1 D-2-hydroxyacid dehydrogenase [Pirellulaceae bacterium]HMP68165.1 D-2-hydroxyacid dehydrogenase [Pirellulaceae bacterium]
MNIVVGYQASAEHVARIRAAAPKSTVVVADAATLAELLLTADIFVGHVKTWVDWPAIVAKGKLRWIQSSAAGLDHCLAKPVKQASIFVSSASALFADQVAEQTLALTLGLLRRIHWFVRAETARRYERLPTDDLHGKRVAIIGFGGNGQRIAEVLKPFRVSLRAVDYFADQEFDGVQVFPPEQLRDAIRDAELAIITLPLTEATRFLFGKSEFRAMPAGAYLINVGRGEVVREADLVAALNSEQLAGAGLDVAEVEPLPPSSALWGHPKVIISPHVGAQGKMRNDRVTELFCLNLPRFLNGQPLINQVEKELGFPRPENRFSG